MGRCMQCPWAERHSSLQVLNQLSVASLMDINAEDLDHGHPERMTIRMGPNSGSTIAPEVGVATP